MNETEGTATENIETTGAEQEQEQEVKGKYYTDEEISLIEQKAGDKRISQYQKTLDRKQRESEKLRNMSDTDKREYMLEQREQAILAKEIEMARLENKTEGLSILSDKGISSKLIDLVLADDAEVMYDNIKILEREFKASVKKEVEARLASKSPTKSLPMDNVITKEQFKKMGARELTQLKNEQPELWAELTK